MTHTRRYTREVGEQLESVFIHVDDNGRVRITADNLHDILTHIGFTRADQKELA